jgi:asparagine synthetase B (glutamine-hydrolysing)
MLLSTINFQEKTLAPFETDKTTYYIDLLPTEYSFETENYLLLIDHSYPESQQPDLHNQCAAFIKNYETNSLTDYPSYFKGCYFIIFLNKQTDTIDIIRDPSGIKSGYYFIKNGVKIIGNVVHQVAKISRVRSFNNFAIYQLLYLDYIFDGFTVYEDIHETKVGHHLRVSDTLIKKIAHHDLEFATKDNDDSLKDNIKALRNELFTLHNKLSSAENIVMLSGGIDSTAILVSLDQIRNENTVSSLTFKVKGTSKDETDYAFDAANYLQIPIQRVEVDPNQKISLNDLKNNLLNMNNPYIGYWVFGQFSGNNNQQYFFGQDTRLHTPALNIFDKLFFRLLPFFKIDILRKVLSAASYPLLAFSNFCKKLLNTKYSNKIERGALILNSNKYLQKYFFKIKADKLKKWHIPLHQLQSVNSLFNFSFKFIKNKRHLYNEIVKMKWHVQYINDMRLLQDFGRINGTYVILPYYDYNFAKFCSSLPYEQVTKLFWGHGKYSEKKQIINKYLLRETVKEQITEKIYYRQKAVSGSNRLMFNGSLGKACKTIIQGDLNRKDSFINTFNLTKFVEPFLNSKKYDDLEEQYLLKMYYVGALCVYNEKILND